MISYLEKSIYIDEETSSVNKKFDFRAMFSETQAVFDNDICRFCCSRSRKLYNIQTDQLTSKNNSLWQLIKRLVPLKIDLDDQKPKQICHDCLDILEKYDTFVSTCLANDIHFDNILQGSRYKENGGMNSNERNISLTQDEKWKSSGDQDEGILVLNKINDSVLQNENFYIIVELNCRGINIDPVVLKYNENKNILPIDEVNEDNTTIESQRGVAIYNHEKIIAKDEKKMKPFTCKICNKSLRRKSNLISHLALHSEDRPHKCNECDKNFAVFADLTLHKHIHRQSYSCKTCKKCFVTKSKLERHRKSHTGVKDHACPICKKMFAEKNNMNAHISVHTGERPFSCSICQKSFRTQSHLTDHGKVHSAESPYKCTLCNKSFKWKSNLKDHSKYHSGEKFKCADCSKEFSVRTDYYKHRKECRQEKT